jgi:bile acid:Na+ symporter, BASS family
MFLLDTSDKILALAFLVTSMLSIGTQTAISGLRLLVASRGFLVRTLVANFLIVPILGVAIAGLLHLETVVAGAIILLGCTPGGLSAIQFVGKVKGNAHVAGALLCMLSFLALFVSPLLLYLVLPQNVALSIPYGRALLFFFVFLLFPLLGGMLLLEKAPGPATKLTRPLALVGTATFFAFMCVTGSFRKQAIGEIGIAAVGAMLLFIVLTMATGWFLGGALREFRQILASVTSMRNVMFCLAMVETTSPGHAITVPLVAFSLLMVPANMLFTPYNQLDRRHKHRYPT